jgi:hypothetical protein
MPDDIVSTSHNLIEAHPSGAAEANSGKNRSTGASTPSISLRSIAMPVSSDTTRLETERMSCFIVASHS